MRWSGFCLALIVAGMTAAATPAASPPQLATAISTGDQFWAAGNLDGAEQAFADAFRANPTSVEAGMKLAGIRLSRQEYADAIETYQRVIGIGAPNAKAWIGMGLALLHTGKPELARAAFEEAVRIEPARKNELDLLIAKIAR
ncbi:MAG: tetratricopeptide repeat protein [Betaproteobacteria bacterium]